MLESTTEENAMLKPRRHPGGQASLVDRGTPEEVARRRYLAGLGLDWAFGVLRSHDDIDHAQYEAALRYAWLRFMVAGKPSLAATRYEEGRGLPPPMPDDDFKELEAEYCAMRAALRCVSRKALDAFENLAIYNRMPTWMQPRMPRRRTELAHVSDAEMLMEALDALARVAGYKARGSSHRTGAKARARP